MSAWSGRLQERDERCQTMKRVLMLHFAIVVCVLCVLRYVLRKENRMLGRGDYNTSAVRGDKTLRL